MIYDLIIEGGAVRRGRISVLGCISIDAHAPGALHMHLYVWLLYYMRHANSPATSNDSFLYDQRLQFIYFNSFLAV